MSLKEKKESNKFYINLSVKVKKTSTSKQWYFSLLFPTTSKGEKKLNL